MQPSPYAVYKFFDFDDHDTTIVPSSFNPQFNNHKTYPVPVTVDLDKYLKSQVRLNFVFVRLSDVSIVWSEQPNFFLNSHVCCVSQPLMVYVFDDTDPEEAAFLGAARVPLIPLAHDKPVKGTFELRNVRCLSASFCTQFGACLRIL